MELEADVELVHPMVRVSIEDRELYIATEWCEGGSLEAQLKEYEKKQRLQQEQENGKQEIKPSSASSSSSSSPSSSSPPCWSGTESQLLDVALQLARALSYLHDTCHLAHMDLKPANILQASASLYKLGDFGLCASFASASNTADSPTSSSNHSSDPSSSSSSSTPIPSSAASSSSRPVRLPLGVGDKRYLCTEALESEDQLSNLPAVDMFAFGLTLYELGSGRSLPKSELELSRIKSGDLWGLDGRVSEEMYALIRGCLHPDPEQRWKAREVVERLEDWKTGTRQTINEMEKEIQSLKLQLEQERLANAQLQQYWQQHRFA